MVPGAPIYFRATKIGADYAVLEWKPPTYDGGSRITSYVIQKRDDLQEARSKVMSVSGQALSATVTGLRTNIDYYFSVCAENKVGLSSPCDAEYAVVPVKPLGKYHLYKLFYIMKICC